MIDSTILVAFITGVLGPVLLLLIKYGIDKRRVKGDMVTDALNISEKVTNKLDFIKHEFAADRVWLAQFHNGGHFYPTGKSIAKFSMVYETVEANVKSIQGNFQNIPVSLFSKPINELLEKEMIEIPDYKDETVATYGLKYIAEESGTKSSYLFAIKTVDDKFIGILAVDYTRKRIKLNTDFLHTISNHATAIGGVLNAHLHKH